MKNLLLLVFVVVAAVYVVGYYSLSERGVNRFLDEMQNLTLQGKAQELCDLLADDMSVAIIDHTAEADRRLGSGKINGGKQELCSHLQSTVRAMPAMSSRGMSVQTQRADLQVKRQQWLHPWSAEVTYNEKQTLNMQAGGRSMAVKTESDDKFLLVRTLSGVRIKRLESEAWLQ